MYKFTNQTSEVKNVEIDLRKESTSLTDTFGINLLYIRNCKFIRCKCFNDLNKTGDPNCKLCYGTGHFASINMIKAIESSNSAYSSTNSIIQTPIGVTDQKNEIYYIQQQYNPKERDILLKVTWDKKIKIPVDIIKVLEITNVYEMRGDNGRVELNGCVINNRTDLIPQFNSILKSLPVKSLQILQKGGKSIWPNKVFNSKKND